MPEKLKLPEVNLSLVLMENTYTCTSNFPALSAMKNMTKILEGCRGIATRKEEEKNKMKKYI